MIRIGLFGVRVCGLREVHLGNENTGNYEIFDVEKQTGPCLALNRIGEGSSPSDLSQHSKTKRVHDVAVAYCLAMAEVWVRLPLDAFSKSKCKSKCHALNEIYCGGARVGTGGRLLTVLSQVRFLPPQFEKLMFWKSFSQMNSLF